MDWTKDLSEPARHESLFNDRVVRCFVNRPANLDAMIHQTIADHPGRTAYVYSGQSLTYAELDERLDAIAGNLAAIGIAKGDRVGVLADNSIDFMTAVFAIVRRGAIAVPLGIRQQAPEFEYIFNDCGLRALVFDAGLADRLPSPSSTPGLTSRYSIGGAANGAKPFEELLTPLRVPFKVPPIAGTDLAMIMYTSGTTGRPKGAMLPHIAFVHSAMHFTLCLRHGPDTRALLVIPASHISGLGAIIVTMLRAGGCVVIDSVFRADRFLEVMQRERITFTVLVPAMYKLCILHSDFARYDLSAWTIGIFGGAIMPPATIAALAERLPGLHLVNGYGATETTSPASIMPLGHTNLAPDSIGKTVPCGDICIMDDSGREVPVGQSGELWIRGPMVAQGYWNNPEATQDNFTAGFWHSGDIGSIDAEGYLRVFDRKKDMINRGGYKVYSAEVENALNYHPDIVECAVVASPDAVLGERVHAFICARVPDLQPEDVRSFCLPLMADYKVPELFSISTEPLPRNNNGKFQKSVLRDRANAAAAARPSDWRPPK